MSAKEALHTETAVDKARTWRRQVTVLFADLASCTTLAKQRDAEEVHRFLDRCFELITAAVQCGPCAGPKT